MRPSPEGWVLQCVWVSERVGHIVFAMVDFAALPLIKATRVIII